MQGINLTDNQMRWLMNLATQVAQLPSATQLPDGSTQVKATEATSGLASQPLRMFQNACADDHRHLLRLDWMRSDGRHIQAAFNYHTLDQLDLTVVALDRTLTVYLFDAHLTQYHGDMERRQVIKELLEDATEQVSHDQALLDASPDYAHRWIRSIPVDRHVIPAGQAHTFSAFQFHSIITPDNEVAHWLEIRSSHTNQDIID